MKIKQLVMISLIVFGLGFMGVLIAGLALPEGARLGGPAGGVADVNGGSVLDGAELANGTPVVTPHNDPSNGGGVAGNNGASTGSSPSGGGSPALSGGAGTSGSTSNSTGSTSSTGGSTASGSGGTGATTTTPKPSTSTPAPTTTTTPKPSTVTPSPAPSCGSPGGICSAAQVASHNTAANCWVIYNAGYYIVTSYVKAHPGGTAVFNSSTCGKDITSYLNGSAATAGAQHRHSTSAYNTLNSYYVGKVQ